MQDEMRDRLVKLMQEHSCMHKQCARQCRNCDGIEIFDDTIEEIADLLIENGVILPLVKVGDIVYTIEKYCNTDPWETEKELVHPWDCENYCGRSDCSFMERRIEEHRVGTPNFALRIESYVGEAYFLTREAAEEKLREKAK